MLDGRPTVCRREIVVGRSREERFLALAESSAVRCIDQFSEIGPKLWVAGYSIEDLVTNHITENRRVGDRAFYEFIVLPDVIVEAGSAGCNHAALGIGKHDNVNGVGSTLFQQ